MPAQAANSDYGTGNVIEGDTNEVQGNNNIIYGDSNKITGESSNNNMITGDEWQISSASGNWLVGNGGTGTNLSEVNNSIIFGDNADITGDPANPITGALIIGDNVGMHSVDTGTIIGNNNHVGSANDSFIIGNHVQIVNGKDNGEKITGNSVIGNYVNIGSQEHPASAAGDNITVIGDHVNVDNTKNRTDSSNSLIYGNNVTMTNSQNSVAMGNNITMTGTNDKGDNVAIGSGISLGQEGGGHATGTVAIGDQVKVSGTDNVVIGSDIDLDQQPHDKVVVLGAGADTDGSQSVSIGEGASSGTSGTAVGGGSTAKENSAAFGFQAVATAGETTVIGPYSTVNSSYSAALGDHVTIGHNSKGSVSVGSQSAIGDNANYAIAIGGSGGGTGASAEERTTIGDGATAAIAMGYGATIAENSKNSIALGNGAEVTHGSVLTGYETNGIAIGTSASVSYMNGVALGTGASAAGDSSIALGDGAKVSKTGTNGGDSIAMGTDASVATANGVALGHYAEIGEGSNNSIAIGGVSSAKGGKEPDVKTEVRGNSSNSIAMGSATSVGSNSDNAVAIGSASQVADNAEQATVLGGYGASVNAKGGTALGSNSSVEAGGVDSNGEQVKTDYSTAVGYGSKVTAEDIFTATDLEKFKAALGTEYNADYNITAADFSNRGVFSVGSEGGERRIINVARGRISENSTDAVNGSQLYGAVKYLEGKIDAAGGGGDVSIDGDDNITVTDTTPTTPGTGEGGTTVPGGETGGGTNPGGETGGEGGTTGGGTTEPGGGSTGGTTGGAGSGSEGQNFTVNMSDNPVFGGHDDGAPGHAADGSVVVTGSNGANRVAINENNEGGMTVTSGGHTVNINKGGDGLVNGLINTEWDWGKYEEGGYKDSSNAATESQLHELVGGIEQDITNMGDQITNLGGEVNRLSGRIDEVGAGAAALAALHPLDFDPDEKWDFAAGYGHYRGENAVAIGAFYRPNEDTMFSIGGTVGNGDEMINAGVSFKIGQGNHVSTSRVAMAKEIIELRKDLEDLRSAMAGGVTGQTLDLSKIQLFPDTPDNHWAYDYVATLAGNGILEGYPDGYFNGDRPITRYEMAAVLYRAMQKGVRLSDRALREFAPELDRIRVDTITKDEQGMPEIQRVRVVKGRE